MKRYLNSNVIENLKESALWQEKIKNDCEKQNIFFTIRENRIDLYCKGGKLFSFENGEFKTHIKYAAVIAAGDDSDQSYLTESKLKSLQLSPNYYNSYERIKENCSKYSGVEATGISSLYHAHSYLSDSDFVVLDIEVSFASLTESGNKKDRIDLLLLDRKTGVLQFVEAKHFSNKELWSKSRPPVISQLERYEGQIQERKEAIITEYGEYVKCVNSIFGLSLPQPNDIEEKVSLLIFGFDDDQKNGRLEKLINQNENYKGVKTYQKGNIKEVNPHALWKGKTLNG